MEARNQPPTVDLQPPTPAKRGVFYGWWVVLSGALAHVAYAEQFNSSYGVFVQAVTAEMGWSRTAVAAVQTVSRLPEALLAPFLGRLVDRHGARWLVGIGGLVVGVAFMALSTVNQLWELYLYKGLLMPLGAVCLGGYLSVTVSNWFVAKRGRALALTGVGSSAGTMVMPLLAAFMIGELGWRQAWFLMGPMVIVLAGPAVLLFRRRPEDLGLQPDGPEGENLSPRLAEARERRRRELMAADVEWSARQVLRTPALWILVFSYSLSGLGVTGTNLHLIPFMQDLGYPLAIAAAGISLRAAIAIVTGPVWGLLMERIPMTLGASAEALCKAVSMLVFLFFPTPLGLIIGLVLYGIGNAGSMVVHETIWANYFGRISLGTVRSLVAPLQMASSASGPLVLGLLFDLSGGYDVAWLILALGFAAAAALVLFARPPRQPQRAPPVAG